MVPGAYISSEFHLHENMNAALQAIQMEVAGLWSSPFQRPHSNLMSWADPSGEEWLLTWSHALHFDGDVLHKHTASVHLTH